MEWWTKIVALVSGATASLALTPIALNVRHSVNKPDWFEHN